MKSKPVVLFAGVEPSIESRLRSILDQMVVDIIQTSDDFMNRLDSLTENTVDLVICGPSITDLQPIELAQSLKAQIQGRAIYFVSSETQRMNETVLLKNGIDENFFLPFDAILMKKTLKSAQQEILGLEDQIQIPVPVNDFTSEVELDFDVMVLFPLNQKYVRINRKGNALRKTTLQNLNDQGVKDVLINRSDEKKFQAHHAQQKKSESLSSRRQILHTSVRNIFHSLMAPEQGSFDEGTELLSKAQKVLDDIIVLDPTKNVYESFFNLTGQEQGDPYEESLRVATYASMFSKILGIGQPLDLALAGLFHHVGLINFPEELIQKSWDQMTPDEKKFIPNIRNFH